MSRSKTDVPDAPDVTEPDVTTTNLPMADTPPQTPPIDLFLRRQSELGTGSRARDMAALYTVTLETATFEAHVGTRLEDYIANMTERTDLTPEERELRAWAHDINNRRTQITGHFNDAAQLVAIQQVYLRATDAETKRFLNERFDDLRGDRDITIDNANNETLINEGYGSWNYKPDLITRIFERIARLLEPFLKRFKKFNDRQIKQAKQFLEKCSQDALQAANAQFEKIKALSSQTPEADQPNLKTVHVEPLKPQKSETVYPTIVPQSSEPDKPEITKPTMNITPPEDELHQSAETKTYESAEEGEFKEPIDTIDQNMFKSGRFQKGNFIPTYTRKTKEKWGTYNTQNPVQHAPSRRS